MPLITYSDIIEFREKLYLKGLPFFLGKLNFSAMKRARNHWNSGYMPPDNWWNIPAVRQRWNEKITGDSHQNYIEYVTTKYLKPMNRPCLMLSIGCGTGSQEIEFAMYPFFKAIHALDLAENNIVYAREQAAQKELSNLIFFCSSLQDFKAQEKYDVVLFHSSLHHLKSVSTVLPAIKQMLKDDGILIIHEYVGPNRIAWTKTQLDLVNQILGQIPYEFRTYYGSRKIKYKQTAPSTLRMVLSDPSEAVDSNSIRKALRQNFKPLEEKEYGGNILAPLLKGISHHFINENKETKSMLLDFFKKEDNFIQNNPSDHLFGVYTVGKTTDLL